MMGRLLCPEQSEPGRKAADTTSHLQPSQSPYMSTSIPLQQNTTAFPPISPTYLRANSLSQRSVSSFTDMPPLQERSHSAFQKSLSAQSEIKEVRSSAVSPTLKLPPILSSKAASAPEVISMPPQSNPDVLPTTTEDGNIKCPSLMDMRLVYENMMVSYFMPQSTKSENSSVPENLQPGRMPNQVLDHNHNDFNSVYASHPLSPVDHIMQPCNSNYMISQNALPNRTYPTSQERMLSYEKSLSQKNSNQTCISPMQVGLPSAVTQHTSRDVTSSGCTLMDGMNFTDYQQHPLVQTNKVMKSESGFDSGSLTNVPPVSESIMESSDNEPQSSVMVGGDQNTNMNDMSAVLNELSMLMPSQDSNMANTVFSDANNVQTFLSTASTANASTCTTTVSSTVQYQPKSDPTWGRFSVLPPVMSSATPGGGCISDSDNISLMSYNSVPSNAQSNSQMGMYYTSFSPFSVNFSDNLSSAFAPSPRYSGRSSYSGRGSRNKRALSNSPLSADGIDLNSIIRMSPTSLIAYINGSRSSSSCVSPGSIGERAGCYGHLSARSSSSPNSGSTSSGNRRSTSYTPQTATPGMSNSRSTHSNITSDNSNISEVCNEVTKTDFLDMDDNLLVIQAMQDLEGGTSIPGNATFPYGANIMHQSQLIPECENLQVLPQDIAAFRTEDFLPFIPSILPPVHTHIQPQYQPTASQPRHNIAQHNKPPPTYDQHMARKATLQKNSSSESSSQPSNSSSFESSEGDKTVAGNSSTDTESNRMFACRWLDCTAVFQDQDEFVVHIEKAHVDQKKGEEFICYWKLCPRRLHPFNARYKLLVHMRVHSGDKPNKCSYSGCKKAFSRLENLKIHLRSHTGERPYSCTFPGCTKTFSNSSDRTKHQKTHHETKPYVCQVAGCGKRYTDPSSLRKHVKKSHPEKKEPERKKIRGVEELDPKDVNECLMIQAIKPITLCDTSPPEPTDSGLGRSPRGSQPASSSDHYPGLIYANDTISRSETAQGSSCHTSPSSHHSSPPGPADREKIPPNNNSLRVPILPPIVSSPSPQIQCFSNQTQTAKARPAAIGNLARVAGHASESVPFHNSPSLMHGTRNVSDVSTSRLSDIYSPTLNNHSYKTPPLSLPNALKHPPRESS